MSQVLSRAYNSNLPNSLSNFPLETRDCTSRIPDADISTILFRSSSLLVKKEKKIIYKFNKQTRKPAFPISFCFMEILFTIPNTSYK